jgi:hypothetical protein
VAGGRDALMNVLRNIMEARKDATDWLQDFVVDAVGEETKEVYMSTAERLRQEGRVELLLKQLTHRFGSLSGQQIQQLETASTEQLDRWAEKILDAASIDEVLEEAS